MHKLCVYPLHTWKDFAALQSHFHALWARQYSSTLGGLDNMNYSPSDCFETFPFPHLEDMGELERIGEAYHTYRQQVCLCRSLGLTKVYNLFHDPACKDADIVELRRLHVEMDTAVATAYGWEDIALRHAFYGEGKETRYTLHPDVKGEVLRRLLTLNHERHAEQEALAEEIIPTLEGELEARQTRRANKAKRAKPILEGQTSMDGILIEGALEDLARKRTGADTTTSRGIETAAMMATYLVMRGEALEQLNRLRRYPARLRFTMPRKYRRVRLTKHLYFAQEIVQPKSGERQPITALAFTEYQRGPYTKEIEIMEQEAVRRGWLIVEAVWDEGRSSVTYRLGPKADEAVTQVLAMLGEEEVHLDTELVPLDEEKTVRSEQWTTVHFAWKILREQEGREPTSAEIEEYVHHWKPDRAAFDYNAIFLTYRELKLRGLLQ